MYYPDKSIAQQLSTQARLLSKVQGGISATEFALEEQEEGVHIALSTPSLHAEAYRVEVAEKVLMVYTILDETFEFEIEEQATAYIPAFVRAIPLSPKMDKSQIEARYENGKLHIFVPYKNDQDNNVKRIDIQQQ